MRGVPWRAPYWPWLMRIGLSSPSRNGLVSWSASNDSATAHCAPPGQAAGFRLRPARARLTMFRHTSSDHCHGCRPAGAICDLVSVIRGSLLRRRPYAARDSRFLKSPSLEESMTATDPALMSAEDLLAHY